jgi:toxin ParE1/3/4
LEQIQEFPESGRIIPEFPDLPHRELIIEKHRFFYRIEKKTVWIVAVWHSAQETSQPGDL